MSTKRRGLGRNLEALLGDMIPNITSTNNVDTQLQLDGEMKKIPLNALVPGKYQPRRDFSEESLQDLAQSIKVQGIIQPLVVRSISDGQYEIIAGERRFRAAQIAELDDVPVIIKELPDEAALAVALIENIQREDLNPIEEAAGLKRLIDEFDMTHEQLANIVGKSRASITNLLRLLHLHDDIKFMIEQKQIEMGHARALLSLPEALQLEIAKLISLKGLSVRETENLVRLSQNREEKPNQTSQLLSEDWHELYQKLTDYLPLKFDMKLGHNGKSGKLILNFKNRKELEALLERLA